MLNTVRLVLFDLDDTLVDTTNGIKPYPELPLRIPLIPHAREVLDELVKSHVLCLITYGEPELQTKKIKRAQLEKYFEDVEIVDSSKGTTKGPAIENILTKYEIEGDKVLVVGNRRSHEIREGKKLGCLTAWFRYGKHADETATTPEDHADFEIEDLRDLAKLGNL